MLHACQDLLAPANCICCIAQCVTLANTAAGASCHTTCEQSRANDQFKLATDPSLEGASGGYYIGGRETRANAAAYDAAARAKLWEYCGELSGVKY